MKVLRNSAVVIRCRACGTGPGWLPGCRK
jgi:hypothetical protein